MKLLALLFSLWSSFAFAQGGMMPGPGTAHASAVPTWTFGGAVANTSGSFAGITVGSGVLVVAITETSGSPNAVTAVTFGVTPLTLAKAEPTVNAPWLSIWYGVVSGGTQTITVTPGAQTIINCAISYGVLTNVTTAPTDTQSFPEAATTTPNVTISVPANGIAITAVGADRVVTGTWSNSTLDSNTAMAGGNSLVVAHSTTTGSINPTWTGNIAFYNVVSAAWGP